MLVPHRGVIRLVYDRNYLAAGPGDAIFQLSNTAFDALTFEIWTALLLGARLCVIDKRAALEAGGNARKKVLVPESAHGTNPATAATCAASRECHVA